MTIHSHSETVNKLVNIKLTAPYNNITLVTSSKGSFSVYLNDKPTSSTTLQDSSINLEKITSISLDSQNTLAITSEEKQLSVFAVQVSKENKVSLQIVFKLSTPSVPTASLLVNTNLHLLAILGDVNGGISVVKYCKESQEISKSVLDTCISDNSKIIPNKANIKFIRPLNVSEETIRFVSCSDDCLVKIYEFHPKEGKLVLIKSVETGLFFGIDHFMALNGNGVVNDYCAMTNNNEFSVVNLETKDIIKSEKFFIENKESETDESFFENGIGNEKDKEANEIVLLEKDESESVIYGKLENGEVFDFEIE
eukprot:GAHX01000693.1.p1 GENE.GAHX01000693.1~~GAHX01000693.1.p1  ORF type:complete len:323 (-),score=60.77 GAHX01000693.1:38-967(-)